MTIIYVEDLSQARHTFREMERHLVAFDVENAWPRHVILFREHRFIICLYRTDISMSTNTCAPHPRFILLSWRMDCSPLSLSSLVENTLTPRFSHWTRSTAPPFFSSSMTFAESYKYSCVSLIIPHKSLPYRRTILFSQSNKHALSLRRSVIDNMNRIHWCRCLPFSSRKMRLQRRLRQIGWMHLRFQLRMPRIRLVRR